MSTLINTYYFQNGRGDFEKKKKKKKKTR